MNLIPSRRGLIRIVSFSLAIMLTLLASNLYYMKRLKVTSNLIESEHLLAAKELSQSSDKIYSALQKAKCAASPEMLTKLSGEVITQAANAKSALLDLPLANSELSNTEKFLSQVGNYSSYLATLAAKDELEYKDYLTLDALCDHAKELRDKLFALETALLTGGSSLSELFEALEDGSFVAEGISGIEDSFSQMPKLIYDGPYSDHILEKTPLMTEDANPCAYEEALKKAAYAAGLEEWQLTQSGEEAGKMPCYRFSGDRTTVAVTKLGGYLCYMLKSRSVTEESISLEAAIDSAEDYMEHLGIDDMKTTYYETYNNVLTVNFAYQEDDVICYTDLIKVTVAMDNGEILGFDARGYLVNHRERELPEPLISKAQANESLSPHLSVKSSKLALIPTDNVEETPCWEFKCVTDDDMQVLVYVNCLTGEEEDILLMILSEKSVLAV